MVSNTRPKTSKNQEKLNSLTVPRCAQKLLSAMGGHSLIRIATSRHRWVPKRIATTIRRDPGLVFPPFLRRRSGGGVPKGGNCRLRLRLGGEHHPGLATVILCMVLNSCDVYGFIL